MNRFDALVVDFGGVLTTPLQDAMVAFALSEQIELGDLVRAALGAYAGGEDALVTDFETGRISEDVFAAAFCGRLKEMTGRDVAPEGLIHRLFGSLRLEDDMLAIVGAARSAGLKTGLLSNSWGVALYPRDVIDPLFDAIVISGEVGLRKPDPEIFHLAATELGVAPERCVFVDDHPGHLKAAAAIGFTTVLHRTPAETIAELRTLLPVLC